MAYRQTPPILYFFALKKNKNSKTKRRSQTALGPNLLSLQALFKLVLEVYAEEHSDRFSFGFKPLRNPSWAARNVWFHMHNRSKLGPPPCVLSIDIKKYFDKISHRYLLEKIPIIPRKILYQWLNCGFFDTEEKHLGIQPMEGVAQGGIISSILTNLTLDGLEESIQQALVRHFGKSNRESWNRVVRYADDIVMFVYSYEAALVVQQATTSFLKPRGLELNQHKTKIIKWTNDNFEFVGFEFYSNSSQGKLQSYYRIPFSKIKSIYQRLKNKLKPIYNVEELFLKTNEIICGFSQAFAFCNSKRQLAHLASLVNTLFRKNLIKIYTSSNFEKAEKRREKKKFRKKKPKLNVAKNHQKFYNKIISTRYRHLIKGYNHRRYHWWKFIQKGKRPIMLYHPGYTKVSLGRTASGKSAFHPDDCDALLNVALSYKHVSTMAGKILKRQYGRCKLCEANLLDESTEYWELHHKFPYSLGSKTQVDNLVALCQPCHQIVTRAVLTKDIPLCVELQESGVFHSETLEWVPYMIQKQPSLRKFQSQKHIANAFSFVIAYLFAEFIRQDEFRPRGAVYFESCTHGSDGRNAWTMAHQLNYCKMDLERCNLMKKPYPAHTVYNASTNGQIIDILQKKKGSEISIETANGDIIIDKIPAGPELIVQKGQFVQVDQPLTNNPNVGGFGQGETEIVLQNPTRIQILILFFSFIIITQIFLVLKKKQFEKVQLAEMNFQISKSKK
eukprot:TRINITY_DN2638_c0_g2_i5.p1 TRINITY_DN2638_c0_g2~~TRINITY_DN2638_c0_g2_i5.p1  ORF type:complete len:730 (+),score=-0.91 TRINITY_DN2638_c0_g2_i5:1620-3809(+)